MHVAVLKLKIQKVSKTYERTGFQLLSTGIRKNVKCQEIKRWQKLIFFFLFPRSSMFIWKS